MRLLFTCRRTCLPERTETSEKIGVISCNGTGESFIDFGRFHIPDVVAWYKDEVFPDGRRFLVMSHHFLRAISRTVPFNQTVSVKLWIYDLSSDQLTPVDVYGGVDSASCNNVTLAPGGHRLLAGIAIDNDVIWTEMDLDGRNRKAITRPGDGFSHTPRFSPDGQRLVTEFYVGNPGTRVVVMDCNGENRVAFPGRRGDYHFQPVWSPDGKWIAYVNYRHEEDPGHDTADICIARPDGSDQQFLTQNRPFWLSALYGNRETYGSGSNPVRWLPDGRNLTFIRLKPGSRTAWSLAENPKYDDHFGRDYHPEQARGGTDVCLLDAFTGKVRDLTSNPDGVWDFRVLPSTDGKLITFCRARVGEAAGLHVMNVDGSGQTFLSRGYADKGADHPAWIA